MSTHDTTSEVEIKVTKMACEGCADTVAKAAKSVPGVIDAVVDLKGGTVVVKGALDRKQVVDAITAAGYPSS